MTQSRIRLVALLLLITLLFSVAACSNVSNVVDEAREAVEAELSPEASETAAAAVEEQVAQIEEAAGGEHTEAVHWTCVDEDTGPAKWAKHFADCAGTAQSPIDVVSPAGADLADIVFNYAEIPLQIFNNGHTIQVAYDSASSIQLADATYPLVQLHFHAPSEHKVDGQPAAGEMHLVHGVEVDGNLVVQAVVGVLIEEGQENPAFASIWANLPKEITDKAQPVAGATVNAGDLLPDVRTYYTYSGSLTTPPCTEGVMWLLLNTPIEMSAQQIADFKAIISANNRPTQPLNDRDVAEDTTGG